VAAWAATLRDLGLITSLVLDSYWPETARYGHGAILQAAERLFAADSDAAAAQLCALKTQRRWSPQALTAASMVDLACAMMGSCTAGIRWLVESPAKRSPGVKRPRLDPDLVRQARSFTPPSSAPTELAEVWQQRRTAAAEYAGLLRGPATHLEAKDVLGSLLHMHHNRVHGIDPDHESQTHRLARAVALTTTHLVGSGAA
jgi:thiopeptide-type bacteriocin biosynthesis protein